MAVSIALIILFGLGADYLFRRIKLPGLVGMLIAGILAGPYVLNLISPEMMTVSGDFRKIALIVILLRAGFELRRDTLNRVGRAALTMSCVPAIFEILGVIWVAPPLLGITYLEAAIGAVPLAAGVASGEVILAVAVLSILLTAPIGAIGIMVMGERILDKGEKSPYMFKDLREKMGLPRVGERVMHKESGTVWKVIEEQETWIDAPAESAAVHSPHRIPAIHLRFWKGDTGNGPGTGKTISHRYSQAAPPFAKDWEILYDW